MVPRSTPQHSLRCTKPWWLTDVLSGKSSFWTIQEPGLQRAKVSVSPRPWNKPPSSSGIDERNLPTSATNYALLEFLDGTAANRLMPI
jgi:hypothetical protein